MDELAPRRRGRHSADPLIIEALASGASHSEAARAANVSIRTITRRLTDPSFRRQLDEIQAQSLKGVSAQLTASAGTAINTLVELTSADQPATVRATAARALLSGAQQYRSATAAYEQGADPEVSETMESLVQRANEAVDELERRREMHFQHDQAAGRAPPDPPSCIGDHAAGECDQCAAWQESAHAIVLEHGIDPDGCLTEPGSHVRGQVWPLRSATIQLLNAAHDRSSRRPES
jgi:hypothetical protein